jgi:hypothetical protein
VWSGTSFATPQVAGRFANILASDPTITRADAIQDLGSQGTFLKHYGHRVFTH